MLASGAGARAWQTNPPTTKPLIATPPQRLAPTKLELQLLEDRLEIVNTTDPNPRRSSPTRRRLSEGDIVELPIVLSPGAEIRFELAAAVDTVVLCPGRANSRSLPGDGSGGCDDPVATALAQTGGNRYELRLQGLPDASAIPEGRYTLWILQQGLPGLALDVEFALPEGVRFTDLTRQDSPLDCYQRFDTGELCRFTVGWMARLGFRNRDDQPIEMAGTPSLVRGGDRWSSRPQPEGDFLITGLSSGIYRSRLEDPCCEPLGMLITVAGEDFTDTFTLIEKHPSAFRLGVQVVDRQKRPIDSARVSIRNREGVEQRLSNTDAQQGWFQSRESLAAGDYSITASSSGFASRSFQLALDKDRQLRVFLDEETRDTRNRTTRRGGGGGGGLLDRIAGRVGQRINRETDRAIDATVDRGFEELGEELEDVEVIQDVSEFVNESSGSSGSRVAGLLRGGAPTVDGFDNEFAGIYQGETSTHRLRIEIEPDGTITGAASAVAAGIQPAEITIDGFVDAYGDFEMWIGGFRVVGTISPGGQLSGDGDGLFSTIRARQCPFSLFSSEGGCLISP